VSGRWRLAAAAVAVGCLAACGGGSPSVSDRAASELGARVTAVRAAAGAHDAEQATRALAALRTSVAQLRRAGDVSPGRAAEILAAATAVQDQLVSITTTTTTTTTTVPAPPTAPRGKREDKGDDQAGSPAPDHGKGGGPGKG
jgi:hypothetical protein